MAQLELPILKIIQSLNALGILPFEMRGKSLVLSKFGCARFATLLFVQICTCTNFTYQIVQWNKVDPRVPVGPLVCHMSLTLTYVALLATVYRLVAVKQRARLEKFVLGFDSFLRVFPFSSTGASVFRVAHVKLHIMIFTFHSAAHVKIMYDSFIEEDWYQLTNSAGSVYGQFYIVFLSVPFHCFLNVFEQNFESINRCVAHSTDSITKAVRAYDSLSIGIEQLNGLYGFTLLCFLTVQSLYTTVFLYLAITGAKTDSFSRFMANLLTSMTTAAYIYSLAKTCGSVEKKAGQFSKLLATRALHDKSGQFLTNPSVAIHFASLKKIEFNICDCFNLNLRLGCSMLAACVTYLVIMIQMNSPQS